MVDWPSTMPTDVLVERTVACPQCGHEERRQIATGIPLAQAPELRNFIVDGHFHTFRCAACGTGFRLELPLGYLDFERRLWFTVVPPTALGDLPGALALAQQAFQRTMSTPPVQPWAGEVRRRLVFGLTSLREKLLLDAAGLDDHQVEGLKLALRTDPGLTQDAQHALFFERTEGEDLIFTWTGPETPAPDSAFEVRIPRHRLDAATPDGRPGDLAVDVRLHFTPWDAHPPPPRVDR